MLALPDFDCFSLQKQGKTSLVLVDKRGLLIVKDEVKVHFLRVLKLKVHLPSARQTGI